MKNQDITSIENKTDMTVKEILVKIVWLLTMLDLIKIQNNINTCGNKTVEIKMKKLESEMYDLMYLFRQHVLKSFINS